MEMRNLSVVIDDILAEVPENHSVIEPLEAIQNSARYSAPENIMTFWNECAMCLGDQIGEPKEEWQLLVAEIFSGLGDK